jgi:hypothetical protein
MDTFNNSPLDFELCNFNEVIAAEPLASACTSFATPLTTGTSGEALFGANLVGWCMLVICQVSAEVSSKIQISAASAAKQLMPVLSRATSWPKSILWEKHFM